MRELYRKVRALVRTHRADVRRLPAVLAVFALLGAGCVAMCLSAMKSAEDVSADNLVLGIVDKDGSMVSKLAMGIASSHEQLQALFSVTQYPSEAALRQAVQGGKAAAGIILEQGYFDRIQKGENEAVAVILNDQMQVHAAVIRDFADTGELLIKAGEYGANAAWQPFKQQLGEQGSRTFSVFSLQYALELVSVTGQAMQRQLLPYSDSAGSLALHYLLQYTVLLLMLLDMLFFDFVRREGQRSLLCRLRAAGVRGVHLLLSKLPRVFVVKAAVLAGVLALGGLKLSAAGLLSAVGAAAFVSLTGVCLCALLQRSNVGPCLLCAVALAGLFLCGGLVPYNMIPRAVSQAGILTPHGMAAAMLSPLFGGGWRPAVYPLAAAFGALLFWGACRSWSALCEKGGDAA